MILLPRQRSTLSASDVMILKTMKPADFERLARASALVDYRRQGDPMRDIDGENIVVIVCKGIMALQQTLSDGRRSLAELFQAGDILDCRRKNRRFQGELVCLAKSRLYILNATIFDEISVGDPQVLAALQERQREQMHQLRDHCLDIGKKHLMSGSHPLFSNK